MTVLRRTATPVSYTHLGGSVRGINAKGQGSMPRKKIDALTAFVKDYGAKVLAYIAIGGDGTLKSSFTKFLTEEETKALVEKMGGENGDLLLFAADKNKVVYDMSLIHIWCRAMRLSALSQEDEAYPFTGQIVLM